jgi:hypothetical protein
MQLNMNADKHRDILLARMLSTNMVTLCHLLQMPGQFSFAVTLMNVLLVLSQTEFSQSLVHSGVMQNLWMQLLPPAVQEITEQVNSATVSMILFTWRILTYHFLMIYVFWNALCCWVNSCQCVKGSYFLYLQSSSPGRLVMWEVRVEYVLIGRTVASQWWS